mmetsp:Transcript_96324/g.241491  ORF Transcript_96324/g.241491 Transcript_96324/m.241491 type:complete len:719 (-) Transcript_96324:298-2454(-)|eukprot:CAMPEP_0115465642 /NCGR_PEP_ID=MMETSP0271-20121206/49507_1 /TAXON_ID=71861 /ORGANISM="Scrippsiella trochoidea, Strain CCMP3099" /LENGTH=718 /DNA_ID=CAMNT_0002892591 /DNA_START=63 /DNA_END=2219 /DNA_ORIENTATION=+
MQALSWLFQAGEAAEEAPRETTNATSLAAASGRARNSASRARAGSEKLLATEEQEFPQATLPVTNDEGAPVMYGKAFEGRCKLYCGRELVGAKGRCGPDSGPQCPSCKRFQKARETPMARQAAADEPALVDVGATSQASASSGGPQRSMKKPIEGDEFLKAFRQSALPQAPLTSVRGTPPTAHRQARLTNRRVNYIGEVGSPLPPCPEDSPISTHALPSEMTLPAARDRYFDEPDCVLAIAHSGQDRFSEASMGEKSTNVSQDLGMMSFRDQDVLAKDRGTPPLLKLQGLPSPSRGARMQLQARGDSGPDPTATLTLGFINHSQMSPCEVARRKDDVVAVSPQMDRLGLGRLPLKPSSGSVRGGTELHWVGEQGEGQPVEVLVGGRPCAALHGCLFVTPMRRDETKTTDVDVVLVAVDGTRIMYPRAFTYWVAGEIYAIVPPRCPVSGDQEVRISTSDLGASISEVRVGGLICELLGSPTATEVCFFVPPAKNEGSVLVEVFAPNGNCARASEGLFFFMPEIFGSVGNHIAISNGGLTVTRIEGVNRAVCLGAFPLRHISGGFYFEFRIDDVSKSMRAIAAGVAVRPVDSAAAVSRVHAVEARDLPRAWVAGYDRGGALFISDGAESRIPTAAWRPAACTTVGTTIGVQWVEGTTSKAPPALVIFQDGLERVRLPCSGRLPRSGEELVAVVDLQGSARRATLLPGRYPPCNPDDVSKL